MLTREDFEKVAKKNGWKLNPNDKVINGILRVENKNVENYGIPYCPCRPEKIDENICGGDHGCLEAPDEIEEMGHCHCNLYWHPDYDGKNWKNDKI
ncbi:MAG: ferredoxin:thioredoxin reductase [Candidatus Lokiarchaeota archaeon]|nr:ferredoxin:thioredoxin reductase [Candidatus Lokiarchaeota archaeon]